MCCSACSGGYGPSHLATYLALVWQKCHIRPNGDRVLNRALLAGANTIVAGPGIAPRSQTGTRPSGRIKRGAIMATTLRRRNASLLGSVAFAATVLSVGAVGTTIPFDAAYAQGATCGTFAAGFIVQPAQGDTNGKAGNTACGVGATTVSAVTTNGTAVGNNATATGANAP